MNTENIITDPTAHIPDIAQKYDWDYEMEEDGQANILVPNDWTTQNVAFLWKETMDVLIVRSVIPTLKVPDNFKPELALLLNMINGMCMFGSWFFQEGDEDNDYVVWRKEIHAQIEHASAERIELVLTNTRANFNTFYPVLAHFMAQKVIVTAYDGVLEYSDVAVHAEEAMEYISYGGAPKGRA